MFGGKNPNYTKLRTNLRLCINRLKLLEKKKAELALKARKEIADYISQAKEDRARVRVEHIIREDYLVEAMEIVEMLCDLILARFGLIERMKEMDPGLEEAIATIIWATPRLCSDVAELREVTNQFTLKYGKEYVESCRRNQLENVHEKVMHKLCLSAPPKILIENYMIEISKVFKVPFEPDPGVMSGDSIPEVCDLIALDNDFKMPPDDKPGSGGGGGGGHFMLPTVPSSGAEAPPAGILYPPGHSLPQSVPPVQPYIQPGVQPQGAPVFTIPVPNNGPGGKIHSTGGKSPGHSPGGMGFNPGTSPGPPPLPSRPPNASHGNSPVAPGGSPSQNYENVNIVPPHINAHSNPPLPNYDDVMNSPTQYPAAPPSYPSMGTNLSPPGGSPVPAPRTSPSGGNLAPTPAPRGRSPSPGIPQLPDVPGLPSVPTESIRSTSPADNVDFDDLSRRFEELKRRK